MSAGSLLYRRYTDTSHPEDKRDEPVYRLISLKGGDTDTPPLCRSSAAPPPTPKRTTSWT